MLGRTTPRTRAKLVDLLKIGNSLDAEEFKRALRHKWTERQARYLIRKIKEVK